MVENFNVGMCNRFLLVDSTSDMTVHMEIRGDQIIPGKQNFPGKESGSINESGTRDHNSNTGN